jgi:addiction module HigA family antidote
MRQTMTGNRNPQHPGKAVRETCVNASGLSVTESARLLGVTRQALSNLINCKTGISPEMAIRLAKGFGGTAERWIGLQASYDLSQAMKREKDIHVQRYAPQSAA